MKEYYLYTFTSTHGAIASEKLLDSFNVRMMPTPRAISTSCGMALSVSTSKFEDSLNFFKQHTDLKPNEYDIYHIIDGDDPKSFKADLVSVD